VPELHNLMGGKKFVLMIQINLILYFVLYEHFQFHFHFYLKTI